MNFWEIALLIVAEVLLSLLLFAAAIAILIFLVRRPMRKYKPVDIAIFEKIRPSINPARNRIMLFITFLGKHQFLIPANLFLIFYFLFVTRQTGFSIRIVTIALSSLVLMFLLKHLFQRRRPLSPAVESGEGFKFSQRACNYVRHLLWIADIYPAAYDPGGWDQIAGNCSFSIIDRRYRVQPGISSCPLCQRCGSRFYYWFFVADNFPQRFKRNRELLFLVIVKKSCLKRPSLEDLFVNPVPAKTISFLSSLLSHCHPRRPVALFYLYLFLFQFHTPSLSF